MRDRDPVFSNALCEQRRDQMMCVSADRQMSVAKVNQVKNVGGFPRIVAGIFKVRWTRLTLKLKIRWGTVIYTRHARILNLPAKVPALLCGRRASWSATLGTVSDGTSLRPGASDSCYCGVVAVLLWRKVQGWCECVDCGVGVGSALWPGDWMCSCETRPKVAATIDV